MEHTKEAHRRVQNIIKRPKISSGKQTLFFLAVFESDIRILKNNNRKLTAFYRLLSSWRRKFAVNLIVFARWFFDIIWTSIKILLKIRRNGWTAVLQWYVRLNQALFWFLTFCIFSSKLKLIRQLKIAIRLFAPDLFSDDGTSWNSRIVALNPFYPWYDNAFYIALVPRNPDKRRDNF